MPRILRHRRAPAIPGMREGHSPETRHESCFTALIERRASAHRHPEGENMRRARSVRLWLGAAMLAGVGCATPPVQPPSPAAAVPAGEPPREHFNATAYSVSGETAAGTETRRGVVAADPRVLPLGSTIQVEGAGEHSGTYKVEDTGPAIRGRKIDIYVPDRRKAKRFGKKSVRVKVLERGNGTVP